MSVKPSKRELQELADDIPEKESGFWRLFRRYAGVCRGVKGKGHGAEPLPQIDEKLGENPANLSKLRTLRINLANFCAKLASFDWFKDCELEIVEVDSTEKARQAKDDT